MKLTHALVRRYRSIEDSTDFDVEPDVTCLVGKNESGKTATLQALYKSRPTEPNVAFDEDLDYPSHHARELSRNGGEAIVSTELTYELSPYDVAAVESELGEGALPSRRVTVKAGYRFKGSSTWSVDVDQPAVVKHLRGAMELPPTTEAAVDKATTVAAFTSALTLMQAQTVEAQAAVAVVASWRESRPSLRAIDILDKRRPKFVYFGDYDTMPGKVSVPDLIRKRDDETLTRGELALLALLEMAGVSLEEIQQTASHEHLIRQLENASNTITDEVFRYWSQNTNLEVLLSIIAAPEPNATAPLNEGPLLQVRVRNQRHRVTVPFDERSRGFVWFFSFLAYFGQVEAQAMQPLVLLLDEPGLSLHATAQHDLLRFIEERLAPEHQVIYTTHSPFLVDAQRFNRVRTVVDQLEGGTTVSADVLRVDGESAFPLHAALGVQLTQTLFVGGEMLFVEGPSDVVYLQYLSDQLLTAGRTGLDPRWVIVPGGGITKLPAFLTLFGANDLTVAVLTDSSAANKATMAELHKANRLYSGTITSVGTVLGRDEADTEDLLDAKLYLDLVNTAYAGALGGAPITQADLAGGPRIVKDVEAVFVARGINGGKVNHYAPAGALLRKTTSTKATKAVLDRAEKLFEQINKTLGS